MVLLLWFDSSDTGKSKGRDGGRERRGGERKGNRAILWLIIFRKNPCLRKATKGRGHRTLKREVFSVLPPLMVPSIKVGDRDNKHRVGRKK